jgi:hypothetical protein
MKGHVWSVACAAAVVLCAMFVGAVAQEDKAVAEKVEVTLVNTEENLLSQEIWGTWVANADATKLAGGGGRGDIAGATLIFSKDEESTKRFQEEAALFVERMKEKEKDARRKASPIWENCLKAVFATGKAEVRGDENEADALDFGVANLVGNQVLIMLLPDKSAGAGYRLKSFNDAFVRDAKGDKDLLWIGGDHRNAAFTCVARVPK